MLTNPIPQPPSASRVPESTSFHPREFRNAMGRFATGVSVVTTEHQGRAWGMTANSFISVSLDPPLVLFSLDNRSNLHQVLPQTGRYGVSVLAEGQEVLSDHFAGRVVDGVEIQFTRLRGLPLLEGAVAHFIARVVDIHAAGDHTLYIGHVEHVDWCDGKPLLFHAGRYMQIHPQK